MTRAVTASCLAYLLVTLLSATPVAAQNDDVAAEALFVEGRRLTDAGEHARACAKFDASDKASPSVGARINLGDCLLVSGKTASAWAAYRRGESLARQLGDMARAAAARSSASTLAKKLIYLQIDVEDASRNIDGLVVRVDGKAKSAVVFGQPVPIDPGPHELTATAAGYGSWSQSINAKTEGATMVVFVPALEKLEPAAEPAAPKRQASEQPTSGVPSQRPVPANIDSSVGVSRRRIGLALGGAGIAALATGGVFAVMAKSTYGARDCTNDNVCTQAGLDDIDSARSRATVATVLVGAGVAAAAVGAVVYLTAPKARSRKTVLAPTISGDHVGVALVGRF